MAMSRALERFDDELHDAKPPGWKVREKARRGRASDARALHRGMHPVLGCMCMHLAPYAVRIEK